MLFSEMKCTYLCQFDPPALYKCPIVYQEEHMRLVRLSRGTYGAFFGRPSKGKYGVLEAK